MNNTKSHKLESRTKSILRSKKGLTFIELMVVMVIIGTLASIAIPQYIKYNQRGYDAMAKTDAKNFYKEAVNSIMQQEDIVIVWYLMGSLPPGYRGMEPLSGSFFVYYSLWPAGKLIFCNAKFKHPRGKTTYMLSDDGVVESI